MLLRALPSLHRWCGCHGRLDIERHVRPVLPLKGCRATRPSIRAVRTAVLMLAANKSRICNDTQDPQSGPHLHEFMEQPCRSIGEAFSSRMSCCGHAVAMVAAVPMESGTVPALNNCCWVRHGCVAIRAVSLSVDYLFVVAFLTDIRASSGSVACRLLTPVTVF